MRRLRPWQLLWLAPALTLLAFTLGCPTTPSTEEVSGGGTPSGPAGGGKTELASTGWGTLKGKVTLEGAKPEAEIKKLDDQLKLDISKNTDKNICLDEKASASEKEEQAWRIGPDNGVQNVVVWLRPPEGNYFKIDMEHPTWEKTVMLNQPHCAFIPHVLTLFPSYFDGKKEKDSGQEFFVENSAPMKHNTKWSGGTKNPGDNITISQGEKRQVKLKPDYNQEVDVSCGIHGWMNAYIWVFDHPYAAVTNEKGEYEIKHVPTGVDVQVVAWHEKAKFITPGQAKGEKISLKEGDNTKDFKFKAPE